MATIPVEITWVTAQVCTAAQLNSNLRDAVNFMINRPVCQVRQTVAQSIPNNGGGSGVLLWDTEDIDNDNMHSTVTNTSRLTGVTAGRYDIGGGWTLFSNATGIRAGDWQINGTPVNGGSADMNAVSGFSSRLNARSLTVFLNVGDFLEITAFQNSGSAQNTVTSSNEQSVAVARWVGTT